jgi:hypothetical protein
VASVDGGEARVLVQAASRAEYAAGRLLFVKDGNLMAQPFDTKALAVSDQPQRIVERVGAGVTSTVDAAFSVSTNGTLADGRRLYYLTAQFQMKEVQVSESPNGLQVSPPVDLFRAPTANGGPARAQF